MREMRALLCITALAQAFLHAPRRTIRRQTIRATASDDDEGFSIAGDEEEVSLDLVDLLRAPPDAAPNRNRSVDYFGESTSEQDQEWSEEADLDRLPVADLEFDKDLACRGLVIDKDRGNFLKIDRHGFVRRAMHGGARSRATSSTRSTGGTQVDLRSNRFSFLNTLFSVSEGVMYAQLVSKLDSGALFRDASPPFDASRVANYADLHRARAGKECFKLSST
ncbi:5'-nucleotidase [Aureococcus anophagefferens]|uniref:5'-nucleotidase n=1 Tax=Aureococcus anophagefferens TaxID=44056 RepID=A0ABR1FL37_AURAN